MLLAELAAAPEDTDARKLLASDGLRLVLKAMQARCGAEESRSQVPLWCFGDLKPYSPWFLLIGPSKAACRFDSGVTESNPCQYSRYGQIN